MTDRNAQDEHATGSDPKLNEQQSDTDDSLAEVERQEAEALAEYDAKREKDPEKRAALRKARKAEWSEKLLGKRYVMEASTEPNTFSDQDLPKNLRHRVIFAGTPFDRNWYEDRVSIYLDRHRVCYRVALS